MSRFMDSCQSFSNNAFMIFLKEFRILNPNRKQQELTRTAGEYWQQMTDTEKCQYFLQAAPFKKHPKKRYCKNSECIAYKSHYNLRSQNNLQSNYSEVTENDAATLNCDPVSERAKKMNNLKMDRIAATPNHGYRNKFINKVASKAELCMSVVEDEDFIHYFKFFIGTQMVLCCMTVGITLWHFTC